MHGADAASLACSSFSPDACTFVAFRFFPLSTMSIVEDQLVAFYDVHALQILERTGLDPAATASLPRWRKARLALAYLDRVSERSTVT